MLNVQPPPWGRVAWSKGWNPHCDRAIERLPRDRNNGASPHRVFGTVL
jgi:hypothetical protein